MKNMTNKSYKLGPKMKNVLTASLGMAIAAVAFNANANNGTITFNGSVISSTCSIGGSGANASINLPSARISELDGSGKTAGDTPFSISLESCTAEAQDSAYVYFETGLSVTSDGRLQNTATDGAQNVELEILDGSGNQVKLGDTSQRDSATTMDISSGAAALDYTVRYYATGVATEGAVTSQVTYTITYE